jgi:hypothetical protein
VPNQLTPELLSKCRALYVPVSRIGDQSEVESLVVETGEGFYLISFEEKYSDISHKIDMFVAPANSEQISVLDKGISDLEIKKFTQKIESIRTYTKVSLLNDGGYQAEQHLTLHLDGGVQILLRNDAMSTYPYSFHLEIESNVALG